MKVQAVLRRGFFTAWIKVEDTMNEIKIPVPDEVSMAEVGSKYGNPAEAKTEIWCFRKNQYLAKDMVEYVFERVEQR